MMPRDEARRRCPVGRSDFQWDEPSLSLIDETPCQRYIPGAERRGTPLPGRPARTPRLPVWSGTPGRARPSWSRHAIRHAARTQCLGYSAERWHEVGEHTLQQRHA